MVPTPMTTPYGLGRIVVPDEGDKNYPMLKALQNPSLAKRPVDYKYWWTSSTMNQGNSSMCVAYTWRQWLNSAPVIDRSGLAGPDVYRIYQRAQQLDDFPGTAYQGTTVRAGAKVMEELGFLKEYVWASSAEEIAEFVLTQGTACFGTNWYKSMFTPRADGYVKISPDSPMNGGHAYLCTGYNKKTGLFRFVNSWGPEWGSSGRFYMSGETVERLIREDGEACGGLEIKALPKK